MVKKCQLKAVYQRYPNFRLNTSNVLPDCILLVLNRSMEVINERQKTILLRVFYQLSTSIIRMLHFDLCNIFLALHVKVLRCYGRHRSYGCKVCTFTKLYDITSYRTAQLNTPHTHVILHIFSIMYKVSTSVGIVPVLMVSI